jgi:uncharacterized lipoprotein YmbA
MELCSRDDAHDQDIALLLKACAATLESTLLLQLPVVQQNQH